MAFRRSWIGVLGALVTLLLAGCAAGPVNPPAFPTSAPGDSSWTAWPSALHDARHSGASTEAGPTTGRVRWRRKLEDAVTPGVVVARDGTLYASSNAGVLHALDPADGTDRWTYDSGQHNRGSDLSVSPLVLPDGTVLFPAGNQLVALSPTGQHRWTQQLPGTVTSPVSADGTRVYVGDTAGTVSALDVTPTAHHLGWQTRVGAVSYGSVVTDGRGRIYTTADSALVALDDRGNTGHLAWRADPGDNIVEVSAGLAPDGTVLLGTNGHSEWAYRPDGTQRWRADRVITYSSPTVTASGLAYVADHGGIVHVFDALTGTTVAHYGPVGAQIWSSTVVDRNYRAYFAGQNGHAYGFDEHGRQLFDVNLGGPVDSYPALTSDANLLVGSRNGYLTAIG